jgi:hypothetical protein
MIKRIIQKSYDHFDFQERSMITIFVILSVILSAILSFSA